MKPMPSIRRPQPASHRNGALAAVLAGLALIVTGGAQGQGSAEPPLPSSVRESGLPAAALPPARGITPPAVPAPLPAAASSPIPPQAAALPPPTPGPVPSTPIHSDKPITSTSSSGQFIVHGRELGARSAFASRCDETAARLRQLLRDNERWVLPVVVSLKLPPEPMTADAAVRTSISKITDGGFHLQLSVQARPDFRPADLDAEVVRVCIAERILRGHQEITTKRSMILPEWLLTGIGQALNFRDRSRPSAVFAAIFKSGKIYGIEEILDVSPGQLDALSRAIYETSCCALVLALLDQPDGPLRLKKFLSMLASDSRDDRALLNECFPSLALSASSLNKWWSLQMASLATPSVFETLDPAATRKELEAALMIQYQAPADEAPKRSTTLAAATESADVGSEAAAAEEKKRGLLGRLFGGGDSKQEPTEKTAQTAAKEDKPAEPAAMPQEKPAEKVAAKPADKPAAKATKPEQTAEAEKAADDSAAKPARPPGVIRRMFGAGDPVDEEAKKAEEEKQAKEREEKAAQAMAEKTAREEATAARKAADEKKAMEREEKAAQERAAKLAKEKEAEARKAAERAEAATLAEAKAKAEADAAKARMAQAEAEAAEAKKASAGAQPKEAPKPKTQAKPTPDPKKETPKPAPKAEPAEPQPKQPGLLRRLFGAGDKKSAEAEAENKEEATPEKGKKSAEVTAETMAAWLAELDTAWSAGRDWTAAWWEQHVLPAARPVILGFGKKKKAAEGQPEEETKADDKKKEKPAETKPAKKSAKDEPPAPAADAKEKPAAEKKSKERKPEPEPAKVAPPKPAPKPAASKAAPSVKMVPVAIPIEDYASIMKRKDRSTILERNSRALSLLLPRANVLFRPLINDYLAVVNDLRNGRTKDMDARLTALRARGGKLYEQARAVQDHLDWFEASETQNYSGAFEDYLKLPERIEQELPMREDSLSKYLDALDLEFGR